MPLGIEIDKLLIGVGLNLDHLKKDQTEFSRKFSAMGDKLKTTGKQLTTRVSAPLLGIGIAAIKAASDAEEMQSKFNIVFKNVGGSVTKQLDTFSEAVGRNRFELMGMASTFGDLLKPLGFTEKASGTMSVQLTKLATDLSSFNNMSMDDALQKLRGTLVGSHENALDFAVVINENVLKAELARNGWDKLTGSQLEQAKVQARINLLIAGTTDAQGDAARTAESFANQVRGLFAKLKEVGVEIGRVMIPVATKLIKKLKGLVEWVKNLSPEKKKLLVIIAGITAALPPLAVAIGTVMTIMSPWTIAIAAVVAGVAALILNWDSIKSWIDTKMPIVGQGLRRRVDRDQEDVRFRRRLLLEQLQDHDVGI